VSSKDLLSTKDKKQVDPVKNELILSQFHYELMGERGLEVWLRETQDFVEEVSENKSK
jgi:hypothetical protein